MIRILASLCLSVAAALSAAAADRGGSVGLVLSGGGAKGIAHIGVLQALEDNDIPIDYVAGTSMGAIVGGLYAAGYTPAEMMDLILSKGFADWSTGKIDEKLAYYFSRPAPSPAMITIPVARRDSSMVNSILPTSVISPLPMNFAFMELFSAYTAQCGGDFDKLFVPYRCVASDVYAKRKIVCRGGSLGDAIRASMSFPAVYQPIEMNGVLVYDGGIYDNFPVDVMRSDFAPSIMIGVDVTTPDGKPKSGDVIEQLEDMIIQNNDYSLPADEGIKIHLDLRRFNLLDFAKAEAIYKVGYDRAMEMMDSIKTRVTARVPREARQLSRRVFKSASPYLRFDSVEVTGGNSGQNDYIRYLFTKNRADTFGISSARDSYYQAITPGNLRDLLPTAVYNPSSSLFKLNLKATVKDSFKVGFGGYLSSSTNSMIFLSAGYNSLSFHGVEAIVKGWVGQSYMAGALNARVYMPTGVPSALSLDAVVSRQRFYESASLFYQDKMPAFITNTEAFARLNFSAAAGRSGTFAAGVGFGHLFDSFYQSNDGGYYGASRDRAIYNLAQARVDYRRNTLDNNNFPTAGSSYSLTAIGVTGGYRFHPATPAVESQHLTSTWGQLRLQAKNFFGLGSKLAFGTAVDCLASSRPLVDNYNAAVVAAPSFKPTQSSYNAFNPAFSANSYVSAGLLPVWIPVSSLQLRGDFYCFLPYKKIKEQPDGTARYGRAFSDPAFLGEMALVYNFPFASLSLYGNYMSYPARNWNFGVTFGLFYLAPRFLR